MLAGAEGGENPERPARGACKIVLVEAWDDPKDEAEGALPF